MGVSIMPAQSVTVKQEFECVYFLESENETIDINAHRYRVEVTVYRKNSFCNRVVEFSNLQSILKSILPDNKYLYSDDPGTTQYIIGQLLEHSSKNTICEKLKFEICAENICNWIANNLQITLDTEYAKNIQVTDVVLRENSQCYVNWHKVNINQEVSNV